MKRCYIYGMMPVLHQYKFDYIRFRKPPKKMEFADEDVQKYAQSLQDNHLAEKGRLVLIGVKLDADT